MTMTEIVTALSFMGAYVLLPPVIIMVFCDLMDDLEAIVERFHDRR